MKTIWKFPVDVTDEQTVSAPAGAKWLTAQFQGRSICLWAIVDDAEPKVREYHVSIFGTGNPFDCVFGQYLGTCQMQDDALTFHVFVEG
jgi:hypothetical protein